LPQEELNLHPILHHCRPNNFITGLESCWTYYTNRCLGSVPEPKATCIESDLVHRQITEVNLTLVGIKQFLLNGCAFIAKVSQLLFVFLSTRHHFISGPTTYCDYASMLSDLGVVILLKHSVADSFSEASLVVASFKVEELELPPISHNCIQKFLFRAA